MKKAYVKPILLAENAASSSPLSSSCEGIANYSLLQCSVFVAELGWTIYTSEIADCLKVGPGEDLVCYHNPTDENNVFSS